MQTYIAHIKLGTLPVFSTSLFGQGVKADIKTAEVDKNGEQVLRITSADTEKVEHYLSQHALSWSKEA